MGIIGRLFGTEKALTEVVQGVSRGLDSLVYTDQEKANDSAAATTEARQLVVKWMEATQGQNLSRRLIALSIVGSWLSMKLMATSITILSVFAHDSQKYLTVSDILNKSANDMGSIVMLIISFYFAAPHMGKIAEAVTSKFAKKA